MAEIDIQLLRTFKDRAASLNPVLLDGQPCIEVDTKRFKLGDGVTAWNSLPYYINKDEITAMVMALFEQADDMPDLTLLFENGLV